MKTHRYLVVWLLSICLVTACALAEANPASKFPPPSVVVTDDKQAETRNPSSTALPSRPHITATITNLASTASPEPTNAPTEAPEVCTPLEDIPLSQLLDTIVNPYSPPPPGSDDPHQGVDFADLYGTERIAIPGRQVNAVLSGKVVLVITDRFPYGNAVMVETGIPDIPIDFLSALPTPAPTPERKAALSCPEDIPNPTMDETQRSLYLLYAHLQDPPTLKTGDLVSCGGKIGSIGSSGNALNPHLHLEARLGLSGQGFPSMAHYDSRATPEEMHAYCLWRISGIFQLVDPHTILDISLTDR